MPTISTDTDAGAPLAFLVWDFTSAATWEVIPVPNWARTMVVRVSNKTDVSVTSGGYSLYIGRGIAGAVAGTDELTILTEGINPVQDFSLVRLNTRFEDLRMAATNTDVQVFITFEGVER